MRALFVNSSDNSFYLGSSENKPIRLGTELDPTGADTGMPPYEDIVQLGNTITWVNHEWIVVHVTTDQSVLALNGIEGTCRGMEAIVSMATRFELENFTTNQLLRMMKVGATGVFEPDFNIVYVMDNGMLNRFGDTGYDWFTNNTRRSVRAEYWTSSFNGNYGMYTVSVLGEFNEIRENQMSGYTAGFRPCVCIDLTKYTVS